jgi:outer membrane protein assembly factor BamB
MLRTASSRVALVAAGALLLTGCVWGSYRYGPDRTGSNPVEKTLSVANVGTLQQAWSVNAPAASPSAPAVYISTAYVAAGQYLRAINVINGATLWTVDNGFDLQNNPLVTAPPVVTASGVWAGALGGPAPGCGFGNITEYDRATGAVIRGVNNPFPFCGLGAQPTLFATVDGAGNGFFPFQLQTQGHDVQGLIADARFATVNFTGTPTLGGTHMFASYASAISAFDLNGVTNCVSEPAISNVPVCEPQWQYTVDSAHPVAYTPSALFASQPNGTIAALDPAGCGSPPCAPMWIGDTGTTSALGAPAVANGTVYVGSADGNLYAFAAAGCGNATCAPLWKVATGGTVGDPTVANGVVYFGSADGKVYAADASGCGNATCNALWSSAPGAPVDGEPVIATATVYVSRADGTITAYRP